MGEIDQLMTRPIFKRLMVKIETNKPDRATMHTGRVSVCIDHVTYMESQMDEQTGETTKW